MSSWSDSKINKIIRKLEESYDAKGVHFEIKSTVTFLPGERLQLKVKFLPDTKGADIKRYANDVRLSLKLRNLDVVEKSKSVYLILSKNILEDENHLESILKTDEYREAHSAMGLAITIGINNLGEPVIVDLTSPRCPHIAVSGTTGAGKTIALKSILATIIWRYTPDKVNLLIGDRANELTQFRDLPHLSCPLIEDFDTLLKVMLLLKEEMDRRITMKNIPHYRQLPIIVVVIDEFNAFMGDAPSKEMTEMAVETITKILRMGRHAKIHLILAAHNPTRENMKINTSDLPVKMAFQVANTHNSVTALGEGGAEKLRGNGDMLFKMNGHIQHLHGTYVSSKVLNDVVKYIRQQPVKTLQMKLFPRGNAGFTVRASDLQRMEEKIQGAEIPLASGLNNRKRPQSSEVQLLANIVAWAMKQEEVSCNMLSEKFGIGWRRANGFINTLNEFGIVSDLDAKLPRKVLVQSVEELRKDVVDLLANYGISEQQLNEGFRRI